MRPLFSIITVTYNAQSTLPPTLDSVARQTCNNFEHLIIDGASKDDTIKIAKSLDAPYMHIISEPDKGLYDAMNKGLSMASGKYLIFLNAGDTFHLPTTLSDITSAIEFNNYPDIIYGQTQLVDNQRNRIGDRHLSAPEHLTVKSFAKGMLVCHQAFIAKREIAPEYNLGYKFSADYDWCIRCLQISRSNLYINRIIIDYLSEGVTTANHKASLRERFRIMSHYYGSFHTLCNHICFIPRYLSSKRKNKKIRPINH